MTIESTSQTSTQTESPVSASLQGGDGFHTTLDDLAGRLDSLIQRYSPTRKVESEAAEPDVVEPEDLVPDVVEAEVAAPDAVAKALPEAPTIQASQEQDASGASECAVIDREHARSAAETQAMAPAGTSEQPVELPALQDVELHRRKRDPLFQMEACEEEWPEAGQQPALPVATTNVFVDARIPDELKSCPIMIVDDEEVNILMVRKLLKQTGFDTFITCSQSRDAINLMRSKKPDVVLLDLNMPEVNGLEILRLMSIDETMSHIPALVLTAASDPMTKRRALDLGVNDFLTKPVDPNELTPRVRNALVMKKNYDEIATQAAQLEELVKRRTEELFQSRQQLILSLARAAEHRDNDTGNHVIRVGRYAAIIAAELGWSTEQTELIEQAAQLHDVGKIGVPDSILFKPGKLDPQEYELMRKHCAFGQEIIEPLDEREFQLLKKHVRIGQSMLHVRTSPMLMMASRIAQTHHERWDGTGYPLGLAGEDIPIAGRITAVADVFDALSSKRPYKEPFPREKCFRILEEGRGTHFDPTVLDAFFARAGDIIKTQLQLMDKDSMDRSAFLGENAELFADHE